ncbi:ABC transporter permease [Rhodococcus sp. YL-0]|uniref:ABC transporter permease n=2 Tax=unclassified Rhodococcus (in: high G+C Gram-positive bacteria) TaxID=192944 RepID=UPI00096A80F0|nr:iron chelate uptake ABC transporter family permease subunit [Rhodococcus sp. YL-0]
MSTTNVSARADGDSAPVSPGLRPRYLIGGIVALSVMSLASLFVGVSDLTPLDLLRGEGDKIQVFVISRLPRLAAILLAGAALSVAGLIMQHLTRNRFVSPSTAGTTEWAMLGILVATLFFGGTSVMGKMVTAIVFALFGTFLFLRLLRRVQFTDMIVVPLVGLMFGGVVMAVTTFFAYRLELMQALNTWTTGDFSGILRGRYEIIWLVVVVMIVAYLYADRFTVAGMGEDFAKNLGVSYNTVVNIGMIIVAITTAVVTVVVGAIPFLGLIIPNLVTMVLGDNLRRVLPFTALAGAGFVLVCDVLGRVIRHPYEIPVGTVASVIGAVVFIALILRARRPRSL